MKTYITVIITFIMMLVGLSTAQTVVSGLQGKGGKIATATGAFTSGNCVKTDSNGTFVDGGTGCPGSSTGVTNIATTAPVSGGPITTTGTIGCPNCVTASAPSAGVAHFAGSTQAVTSSAVTATDTDTTIAHTGVDVNTSYQVTATHLATALPVAQGGTGCTTPFVPNPQTATYTAVALDFSCYKPITIASGTFTITLVASGSQPPNGQYIDIVNYGSGTITVARNGQSINGGTTSISLSPAASAQNPTSVHIYSNGTNYFAGFGPGTTQSQYKVWRCSVITGDPASSSPVLITGNNSPVACQNNTGTNVTITGISAWGNAGSTTVTPILTGGTATSLVTGAITAGTGAWTAGTVNGSPTLHSFSANDAICSTTPCTIDVNLTTPDGTTKYLVVQISGTY